MENNIYYRGFYNIYNNTIEIYTLTGVKKNSFLMKLKSHINNSVYYTKLYNTKAEVQVEISDFINKNNV